MNCYFFVFRKIFLKFFSLKNLFQISLRNIFEQFFRNIEGTSPVEACLGGTPFFAGAFCDKKKLGPKKFSKCENIFSEHY